MGIVDIYNNNTDVDRTYGIKKVINLLNTWGVDLKSSKTLDMFAGDGSFCTDILLSLVSKDSVCWDIDSLKLEKIKTKHNIKTVNDDVISSIKINKDKLIILKGKDDYLTFTHKYGKGKNAIDWLRVAELYEYFDVIPYIKNLFDKECIFIHNLNSSPYNFDSKSKWALERNYFYNLHDASKLDIKNTIEFHKNYFQKLNIKVKKHDIIEREMYQKEVYWWYLIWYLEK